MFLVITEGLGVYTAEDVNEACDIVESLQVNKFDCVMINTEQKLQYTYRNGEPAVMKQI